MPTRRRRATAIIEYSQGILLVGMRYANYLMLPGGGIEAGELPLSAVVREVHEETGLITYEALFLFTETTNTHQHHIFWVRANGVPKPSSEITRLAFYREGSKLPLSLGTQRILARFATYRQEHAALFDALVRE
jgi:8-oxo-dGTP pyrophosphatase MutT (NUDIX family)